MDKLNKILLPYINQGKYPGIQWQININDEKYTGKLGYKNLETKDNISEESLQGCCFNTCLNYNLVNC